MLLLVLAYNKPLKKQLTKTISACLPAYSTITEEDNVQSDSAMTISDMTTELLSIQ